MILIDTNVISELWKVEPYPAVLAWIDAQAVELCTRQPSGHHRSRAAFRRRPCQKASGVRSIKIVWKEVSARLLRSGALL